jgi:hypothetical protein
MRVGSGMWMKFSSGGITPASTASFQKIGVARKWRRVHTPRESPHPHGILLQKTLRLCVFAREISSPDLNNASRKAAETQREIKTTANWHNHHPKPPRRKIEW